MRPRWTWKRRLLAVALALGTVGGFASGFANLGRCHHRYRGHHESRVKAYVTDVCSDAIRQARESPRGDGE